MVIIPNQLIETKWAVSNIKHFEKLGYKFTNKGDKLIIKLEELNKGSKIKVKCICDNCNTLFQREAKRVFCTEKHFCSNKCRNENLKLNPNNPDTKVDYVCDMCGNSFKVKNYRYEQLLNGKKHNLFCSRECQGKWNSINKTGENNPNFSSIEKHCESCGNQMLVPLHRIDSAKYCSEECRRNGAKKTILTNCGYCNVEMQTIPSKISKSKSGKVFCSNECVGKYNSLKDAENRINKICLVCGIEYNVKPSEANKSVTCSTICQKKWQSIYLVGENANNYDSSITDEMRMHKCDWCGEVYKLSSPYKVKTRDSNEKSHFCSKECYREWYAKEWSQQEEWKLESAERAVKMLEDGIFNHTDTEPQIVINKLLDEIGIKYKNEYNCKYVSIDNFLEDCNLMIEINGTFWHCDPRKYNEINYQRQVDRIKSDKIKHTYILNNYGIEILYLWEEDILNNIDLCRQLLINYIENSGKLENYHSFNYYFEDGLKLNYEKQITPYMLYPIEELKKKINISESKRTSKKQVDKWITFNCEQCGEEKEQLKSKYDKANHHYCSTKCFGKSIKKRVN